MLTHENLIEITNSLDDSVKKKEIYIAIPNKDGFMLHEVVGAELVSVDGDMDGEFGVLVSSPVASYHLDGGATQQEATHNASRVPVIRYEYLDINELDTPEKDTPPCEEEMAIQDSITEPMPKEDTDVDNC
jgi:hypothetical protein